MNEGMARWLALFVARPAGSTSSADRLHLIDRDDPKHESTLENLLHRRLRKGEKACRRGLHIAPMRLRVELEVAPEEVPLATELVALLRCELRRTAMRPCWEMGYCGGCIAR